MTLTKLTKRLTPEGLVEHLPFLRGALRTLVSTARHRRGGVGEGEFLLPAFQIKNGLACVLPIFLEALKKGSGHVREQAANGLGEIVLITSVKALRPYVVKITGPLIRIIGVRFSWQVKAAILKTLCHVIDRGGIMVKPFLGALQTTFVSALTDANARVRDRGAAALGKLVKLATRVDRLATDLSTNSVNSSGGVQDAMLSALHLVLSSRGNKVSAPARAKVVAALATVLTTTSGETAAMAARALGCACTYMEPEELDALLNDLVLAPSVDDEGVLVSATVRLGRALALKSLAKAKPDAATARMNELVTAVRDWIEDDAVAVQSAACASVPLLIVAAGVASEEEQQEVCGALVNALVEALQDGSSGVRKSAARAAKEAAKMCPAALTSVLPRVRPPPPPPPTRLLPPVVADLFCLLPHS